MDFLTHYYSKNAYFYIHHSNSSIVTAFDMLQHHWVDNSGKGVTASACFVFYLKIINILLKNNMHLTVNCLRNSKMALKV